MTRLKTSGYGRSHPTPPAPSAEERSTPSCAKCRNLETSEPAACAKGHPFNPLKCGAFHDCSRERQFIPQPYDGRWRR